MTPDFPQLHSVAICGDARKGKWNTGIMCRLACDALQMRSVLTIAVKVAAFLLNIRTAARVTAVQRRRIAAGTCTLSANRCAPLRTASVCEAQPWTRFGPRRPRSPKTVSYKKEHPKCRNKQLRLRSNLAQQPWKIKNKNFKLLKFFSNSNNQLITFYKGQPRSLNYWQRKIHKIRSPTSTQ